MFSHRSRRNQLHQVMPGDSSPLEPYRLHQMFSRTLFFLELPEGRPADSVRHRYAVDVRYFADEVADIDSVEDRLSAPDRLPEETQCALYRDGIQIHRANLPATFPVPGGVIEVASSLFGLTRMHYVREDGSERTLRPDPAVPEGRRARFAGRYPAVSRALGRVAVVVLLISLALSIPQGLEILTTIDVVADNVGTFTSPISLPGWANTAVLLAGFTAAIERALTLRNHWLVDADTTWTALG